MLAAQNMRKSGSGNSKTVNRRDEREERPAMLQACAHKQHAQNSSAETASHENYCVITRLKYDNLLLACSESLLQFLDGGFVPLMQLLSRSFLPFLHRLMRFLQFLDVGFVSLLSRLLVGEQRIDDVVQPPSINGRQRVSRVPPEATVHRSAAGGKRLIRCLQLLKPRLQSSD